MTCETAKDRVQVLTTLTTWPCFNYFNALKQRTRVLPVPGGPQRNTRGWFRSSASTWSGFRTTFTKRFPVSDTASPSDRRQSGGMFRQNTSTVVAGPANLSERMSESIQAAVRMDYGEFSFSRPGPWPWPYP